MESVNTVMLYFKILPNSAANNDVEQKIEGLGKLALGSVEGDPISMLMGSPGNRLFVCKGPEGSLATIRSYDHGLVTVDLHYYLSNMKETPSAVNLSYIRALEKKLVNHLGDLCIESNCLYAPIRRGQSIWSYAVTADERILELDYDKVCFEMDSQWQNIRIMHSVEHGNVLFLDGDLMLGESDLIYTNTLCGIGHLDYTDKDVLILGGGDGGILHELLKQNLHMIIQAEIDVEVINACRQFMRKVCGNSLDELEGPHHHIIIDDCIKVLHDSIQSGKRFDYVINDLTEFPVDKKREGFSYNFETTSLITELSLKALAEGGKLLARGNCLSAVDYRVKFEGDLHKIGCKFIRRDVLVPSFHEAYCLYEIWKV